MPAGRSGTPTVTPDEPPASPEPGPEQGTSAVPDAEQETPQPTTPPADQGKGEAEGEAASPAKTPETARNDTNPAVNEPEPAAETLASGDSPQAAGAKTGPEPAAEAASDSPAEAAPEPTAKADAEPTAEAASEPTTEAASEPTADAASEPTAEAEKPAVSSNPPAETPEPATESPEPTTAANEQAAESTDAPTEVTQPEVTTVASEPDTAAEASEADATTEASEPDATTVASEPEPPTASEPDTAAEATETVVEAAVEPADDAPDAGTEVASALRRLRLAIVDSAYPLVLPSAEDARRVSAALLAQLDDYLLPRLARLDAPLLVVVGGSTGAGKSTLVNSFVRAPVSPAGVLRPTTRTPVLVCNPADTQWFRRGELLPGLTRTTEATTDPNSLHIVSAPALTPGLAFLDAPDIDSVVDANRALAAQLLAAADLWLFVTTASRYADAVPWELLQTARYRGTVTALVLDRVPPEATDGVSASMAPPTVCRTTEARACESFASSSNQSRSGRTTRSASSPCPSSVVSGSTNSGTPPSPLSRSMPVRWGPISSAAPAGTRSRTSATTVPRSRAVRSSSHGTASA